MNGTQAVEFILTIRKRLETGLSDFSSVLTYNHFTQDLRLDPKMVDNVYSIS